MAAGPQATDTTTNTTNGLFAAPRPFSLEEDLYAYQEMLLIRRFEEKAGQLYGI